MKIIKRNSIEVTAVRYFSKKPFKLIIILNMTFTGLHMKKQQFILLNHMQRITVKCMKYYNNVYLFIILKPCPIYFISVAYNDKSARVDPVDCVAQSEYLPAVYYAHYYFLARACVAAASMQISEAAAQFMTDIIADLFIML